MNRELPELAFELLADAGTALPAHTLGLLCYGEALGEGCALPCAQVDLPVLGAGHTVCEAWRSSALPRAGQSGALRYREDGELLFGCLALPEERGTVGACRVPARRCLPRKPPRRDRGLCLETGRTFMKPFETRVG
ncbi:MAG TPA: hypothetical protein PLX20_06010 [Rhodocyclaceae bacterium]|nr:hypothetical protein [Rhodocyclaceae bacterium]HNA03466.1 hypothetical protein [Rhodocyclaceae bacterium]HNH12666.1 hypothetical protein [Rhodocyclaceae bacterium]